MGFHQDTSWPIYLQSKGTPRKLKELFRRFRSQPIDRVIPRINPILRGWVQYVAVGDASQCFSYIRDGVGKKVRRHVIRAWNLRGFGLEEVESAMAL